MRYAHCLVLALSAAVVALSVRNTEPPDRPAAFSAATWGCVFGMYAMSLIDQTRRSRDAD